MKLLTPLILSFAFLCLQGVMEFFGWPILLEYSSVLQYRTYIDTGVSILLSGSVIWIIARTSRMILESLFEKVLHTSPLAKKLLPLLRHGLNILIWGFGCVFILSIVGVNISALLTGAGVSGLLIALAGKEAAGNLLGSLSLIFGKFFKIHDQIRIKGFEGTVEEISLSCTKLIDKSGHTIYIPNKFLTGEVVENLSQKISEEPKKLPQKKQIKKTT